MLTFRGHVAIDFLIADDTLGAVASRKLYLIQVSHQKYQNRVKSKTFAAVTTSAFGAQSLYLTISAHCGGCCGKNYRPVFSEPIDFEMKLKIIINLCID